MPPGEFDDCARQGHAQPHARVRHRLGRCERHSQWSFRALRMVGLASPAPLEGRLETTLRRDRRVAAASLVLVIAIAWLYLWRSAALMDAMDMSGMSMAEASSALGVGTFVLTF